ncbi:MAG: response regulator transcription factor [Nitrospira sp.]|nr:response regulator transcription factor [Nitrospira sp.]
MTVVIADDAAAFRERVKILLADLPGVQVVGESGDGLEALQVILARRPDVAILDIQMPGANGVQVLREVKRTIPKTIVIMMTIASSPEYRASCLNARADFFFDKAHEFEMIRDTLRDLSTQA